MATRYFFAPGRVEIGGNHTDHQHGRVLAAAVELTITAAVTPNGTNIARINSELCDSYEVDLDALETRPEENGTSAALVRGVAAWFAKNGHPIGGFNADISSTIPIGSGLSSSAAFEVLTGNILKGLFGAEISCLEIARAGQFAENIYFGKPCGLMDQTASSFGGLNIIDFSDPDKNKTAITPVTAELPGYSLCVVETGGSHTGLAPDYAAIPNDMQAIAAYFGKKYLRELPAEEFYTSISNLRHLGDRAILRAIHFYEENERVLKQADALARGDKETFFKLVIESGHSSLSYLQNVFNPSAIQEQGLTLALALSEKILAGTGAWRVHGGGFAGTILSFVPEGLKEKYSKKMSSVFGENCCHFLNISKDGSGEAIANAELREKVQ